MRDKPHGKADYDYIEVELDWLGVVLFTFVLLACGVAWALGVL